MPLAKQLEVLVVDDTSVSRALLCNSLTEIGVVNQRVAKDGEAGLQSILARPVHLIISDLNMPKMNGLELLRAVRNHKPTAKVGFILVSGRNDDTIINHGRKLGLNNFLPKPFTTSSVRACLESVVGKLA